MRQNAFADGVLLWAPLERRELTALPGPSNWIQGRGIRKGEWMW